MTGHDSGRIVITGATKGGSPNRLDIHDLIKDKKQFSLYIQALHAMYDKDQNDDTSFFGVGSIHGLPYEEWGCSGEEKPESESGWGGYCHHGTTLFPTWHRPYIMLFEQVLQAHAVEIAKTYCGDKEQWEAAATNLRAPYWDWAANSIPPEEVTSMETVEIIKPDGKSCVVPNPLLKYTFHPIHKKFPAPYSGWKTTLRHPTSSKPDATSNVEELKAYLHSSQLQLTSATYNLLTRVSTWAGFSNHTVYEGRNPGDIRREVEGPCDYDPCVDSLESIHDYVHFDVGMGGQIGDPSIAGFDPIFYLHHANVDRIFLLWSALRPTVWVTKGPVVDGTYTIPIGAMADANTGLTPFWRSKSDYWKSTEVTTTKELGYTYPDFNGVDPNSVAFKEHINNLYGKPAFSLFPPDGSDENCYYEWTARVRVRNYEIDQGFGVLLFIGEPPKDPKEWRSPSDKAFVGVFNAFTNTVAAQCENCRNQAHTVIQGVVYLTHAIADRHAGNKPVDVRPFLARELSWRIRLPDGREVPVTECESLEIDVFSTQLIKEPSKAFPVVGERFLHASITAGRPGGHRHRQ